MTAMPCAKLERACLLSFSSESARSRRSCSNSGKAIASLITICSSKARSESNAASRSRGDVDSTNAGVNTCSLTAAPQAGQTFKIEIETRLSSEGTIKRKVSVGSLAKRVVNKCKRTS